MAAQCNPSPCDSAHAVIVSCAGGVSCKDRAVRSLLPLNDMFLTPWMRVALVVLLLCAHQASSGEPSPRELLISADAGRFEQQGNWVGAGDSWERVMLE